MAKCPNPAKPTPDSGLGKFIEKVLKYHFPFKFNFEGIILILESHRVALILLPMQVDRIRMF